MKIVKKSKKRVGRGYGSGRGGHTAGRGTKGQKSRSKIGILFEGVKTKKSLLKRIPLRRGKGKNKSSYKLSIVSLDSLNKLPANSKVNVKLLIKKGLVDKTIASKHGVKVLKNGKLEKKIIIEKSTEKPKLTISKLAADEIVKLGGKITSIKSKKVK